MEKTVAERIKLGIFVILGTTLLVVAAYLIGNRQNLFGQNFTISSVFRNVNGLQRGNNVRYSGINVGTVSDIEMEEDTVIRVYMLIESRMLPHIKKNAVAAIGSDGLVGSMILNILPGEGPANTVNQGDEIPSYSRLSTTDMLSTLNVTNENAALLTADLLKVAEALNNGEGTMGRLLNDPDMADDLRLSLRNLQLASHEANTLLHELNTVFNAQTLQNSAAGLLLADSITARRIDTILNSIQHSGKVLDAALGDMDSMVSGLAAGRGALHYLATDTLLVSRLSRSMKNIEEGSARFNENMEALKHNFLTRRYFRKLEKQKEKESKH